VAKARKTTEAEQGRSLLKAVERIVDSPTKIRRRIDEALDRARRLLPGDATPEQIRTIVERDLVSSYSNRTAIAGGAAALPGVVPGVGSLAALVGGGLIDMTLCLKFEVEMVLALAAARGYRIEDPRERRLAYLLAAAHTFEASGGTLPDLLKAEIDAIWHYTPRQLSKLVAALFVRLALILAGKGLVRAIPLVGVVVSSAANKTLTARVGKQVIRSLDRRAKRPAPKQTAAAVAPAPKKVARRARRARSA